MDGGVEDQVNLLQQPLAMGYILSTAPTGKLPKWFHSTAPQTENMCPAVLKVGIVDYNIMRNGKITQKRSSWNLLSI